MYPTLTPGLSVCQAFSVSTLKLSPSIREYRWENGRYTIMSVEVLSYLPTTTTRTRTKINSNRKSRTGTWFSEYYPKEGSCKLL